MNDAPCPRMAADCGDHGIDGSAGMDDHGQAVIHRDGQLPVEQDLLPIPVEAFDEVVQADFTNRYRPVRIEPLVEQVAIGEAVPRQEHRVHAVCGKDVAVLLRQVCKGFPTRCGNGRHDHRPDAGISRALQHPIAIHVESGVIEVYVAVDERCHDGWRPLSDGVYDSDPCLRSREGKMTSRS
ncbi:hypothetical protein ATSB10_07460 [Dyella thiooxydans]|uniref:Uncharacterized protein n=1 Tax=Dyella thiooxydans TaxID=445710 RepID=A0A160MY89_9GAMM|nr:hypothetical protein ATSB10_07460 [Dyella thiooxydans]